MPVVATVVTGDVPFDGSQPVSKDGDGAPYADCTSVNRYDVDKQIFMLPVSSPDGFNGDTAAFVQLAAPTEIWMHDWTVARLEGRPNVPDPTPEDPNWVFLRATPELHVIGLAPGSESPLYRISGTYVYGRKTAPDSFYQTVVYPVQQAVEKDAFPRTVTANQLEKGLSDVTGGGGGPVGGPAFGKPR